MIKKTILFTFALSAFSASIDFESISYPQKDSEKRQINASSSIALDDKKYKIDYHVIARSGDKIGAGVFGEIQDVDGKALKVSDANDFSSLHNIDGQKFMITHFETVPAAMYLTKLQQNKEGKLIATDTRNIDFSSVGGLWVPCAGSVSPWGTHLGSEEYEPDASVPNAAEGMNEYFKRDQTQVNPYNYGWIPEVKILNKEGNTEVSKHYSMGRFSHELAYVLPDSKTVYMSDDGSNVSIFMYVAEKEKDLSEGTLYVAQYHQVGEEGELSWINLGSATDKEIKKAIDKGITFKDIFYKQNPVKGKCNKTFISINTTFGHECLQVKKGMERLASRLESRRYGAMMGGTSEFRKLEGITYNSKAHALYLSVSAINEGMLDNTISDVGGNNDIRLTQNDCGAVYTLTFANHPQIDSDYVAHKMLQLVKGEPLKTEHNSCNLNKIANPDNISFMPNTNVLIIGEDSTGGHQNDAVWAYDMKKKSLQRLLTTPYGSETTSVYYYENFGGHSYIMATIQHPYGESDEDKVEDEKDKRAYTGYFGVLPLVK